MKFIVALYGQHRHNRKLADSFRAWQEWLIAAFGNPTHLIGECLGESPKMKDGKAYSFVRSRSRFDEQLSKDNLVFLELTSLASRPDGYIAFEWDWDASLNRCDRICQAVLGCDPSSKRGDWLSLAADYRRAVSQLLDVEYGFAALMPERYMPTGYAAGVAAGSFEKDGWDEFASDANIWRRFARDECDRSIRNVFGYQVLNSKHLDIPVGGQRLEDWIKASGDRGRLEPLEGGLLAWTFQEGSDQEAFLHWKYPPLVRVREELKQHHVFPWQKSRD